MTIRSERSRRRRGSALFVTIFMLLALFALSASMVRVSASLGKESSASVDDARAAVLAEAGVRESVQALLAGFSGDVGTMDAPAYLGGGVLWVDAEPEGDAHRIRATAMVGSGRAALDVVVDVAEEEDPLFWATLNSDETLTLNSGVMIDSFDSTLGDYASQALTTTDGFLHANTNGHVASNQDIVLNANAHVFGDAVPGPSGSVFFNMGSKVLGATTPATKEFDFKPIDVPPIPQPSALSLPQGGALTLPPGEHGFTALSIAKNAKLTVQGPATIVVDSFLGEKDGLLLVDATNGPVTIHVKQSYSHGKDFEAQPVPGSPMAVAFMISAPNDITFPSSSKIRGAYYAPEAAINFTSSNEAWGSFAARKVTMSASMKFHYDETLADFWKSDGDSGGESYEVLTWTRTGVEPASLLADRRDPMAVLELDPATLPSPAELWL